MKIGFVETIARTVEMFGEESDFTSIVRPLEAAAGVEVRFPGGRSNGSMQP